MTWVVVASGKTAGKGVLVTEDLAEALDNVATMLAAGCDVRASGRERSPGTVSEERQEGSVCQGDGEFYLSTRCGFGHEHVPATQVWRTEVWVEVP